jgi:serine/threonine protein kinase/predicted ATPase
LQRSVARYDLGDAREVALAVTREYSARAREIFDRAMMVHPDARYAFVASTCAGDEGLLAEVVDCLSVYESERFVPPRHRTLPRGTHYVPESAMTTDVDAEARDTVTGGRTSAPPRGGAVPLPRGVGPYRILGTLGEGGMGVVLRGQHMETGEIVAVKTLRLPHESLLSNFRREILALARLRHPGIVRILGEGTQDGLPWYAMEILEGVTLRSQAPLATHLLRIARNTSGGMDEARAPRSSGEQGGVHDRGPAPRRDVLDVLTLVRRLCAPLAFLHGEGIVHRDLKPENILLVESGRPVLVDFGVASFFSGSSGRDALDSLGVTGGTIAYMAPEQIRGEQVDARADIYSLGCILYELLAGRPPFVGPSSADYVRAHAEQRPAPPSQHAPGLPAALDALVLRMLAKRPRDRIGHATDVAAALARLGAREDVVPDGPRPRGYLYQPALAGRAAAISRLDRHRANLATTGGFVLVEGESGVGKTRLVIEAARNAASGGVRVLAGECLALDGASAAAPLHPFRQPLLALADRCRERGVDETERMLGNRGAILARFEPAIANLPGQSSYPAPVDLPPDAARLRLFECLAATLDAFAESSRVALFLDDLQWADELTIGFLEYLFGDGRTRRARVLVVATCRSEESHRLPNSLLDSPSVDRIRLDRLDENAVASIVGDMLALAAPPAVFSRFLYRYSEGNPFFVAEYLRAAVESGLLWRDPESGWHVGEPGGQASEEDYERLDLPRSLRALVERRLDELSSDVARTLATLAVIGREADRVLLRRVSTLGDVELLEAIGDLLRRHVVEETREGGLRFSHDKLREVAYDRLDEPTRRGLHRATAVGIDALPDSERSVRLAQLGHHWERAGEPVRARACYLAAARRARAACALGEAERLYRAYLTLATEPTRESVDARIELGHDVLHDQGREREALEEFQIALDDATWIGDRTAEGTALARLGMIYATIGETDVASDLFERSLQIAIGAGNRNLERSALGQIASNLYNHGNIVEARATFESVLTICREDGNREAEGATLGNLANIDSVQGAVDEALARYNESLAIARELGDRRGEAVRLANLANLYFFNVGDLGQARTLYLQALAIASDIGYRHSEGLILVNLADVDYLRGQLLEARATCERALGIAREIGNRRVESMALTSLANVVANEGDLASARALLEQSLAIHFSTGNVPLHAFARRSLAALERREGNLSEAERLIREAMNIFDHACDDAAVTLCLCEAGHIALARGASGRDELRRARARSSSLHIGRDSFVGRAIAELEAAVVAADRRDT